MTKPILITVPISVSDDLRKAIRHEYGEGNGKGGRWVRNDFVALFQGLLRADLTEIEHAHGQYEEGMKIAKEREED